MSLIVQPEIASDTNFVTGDASGTPTKVDPGTAINGQGLVPGFALPGQYVNFWLNQLSLLSRRANELSALQFRPVVGVTFPSATGVGLVRHSVSGLEVNVLIKAGASGSAQIHDHSNLLDAGGTPGTMTTVTASASSGSRLVFLGATSPSNAFSIDRGATWTDGGVHNNGPTSSNLIWNPTHLMFISGRFNGTSASYSPTATLWTNAATGMDTGTYSGVACFSNGDTHCLTDGGTGAGVFSGSVSTDGGASWTPTAVTMPNDAAIQATAQSHYLVGNGGQYIYHLAQIGNTAQIAVSTDGLTFTQASTITVPSGTLSNRRIYMCQETGMLVVHLDTSNQGYVYVSPDGVTWLGPARVNPSASVAVAGGRIALSVGASVVITDGIEQ